LVVGRVRGFHGETTGLLVRVTRDARR
jgi:hypothetical protein